MAGASVLGILLTGDHASRPSSGCAYGTLYSCTTHSLVYQTTDAGSTWVTWADLTAAGGSISPTTLVLPGASSPSQTAEGSTVWDTDDDKLTIGTGAARKTMVNEGATTSSGLTMATNKLLGRGSASTGAIEEITLGTGLSYSGTTLNVSGASASDLQSAAYTRSSGDYTTTSNSFADVDGTNMSFTKTTGARRVLVTFAGVGHQSSTSDYIGLTVNIDGTDIGGSFGLVFVKSHSTASEPVNLSFSYLTDVLTAASHTFKLRFRRFSAGTVTIIGTGNANARFAIAELYAA